MSALNETHDRGRRSWISSANQPGTDFPIQNLPLGIVETGPSEAHGCVAIGDQALDLVIAARAGLIVGGAGEAVLATATGTLNPLIACGPETASDLRRQVSALLRSDGDGQARIALATGRLLVPLASASLRLPVAVDSFTDFLCSLDHTRRMGRGTLPPAFKQLPIAYNSRASSLHVSGEPVLRPNGQFRGSDGDVRFGPEPSLDYELELGAFIGRRNGRGEPFSLRSGARRLWGYCLLNDWSARGIQFLESQPLGPFLGKSFATSISPWIVTDEALAPFRVPARVREPDDPAVPPHLFDGGDQQLGGIGLTLTAFLLTRSMRETGAAPACITRTDFRHIYWTFAQMATHHASNGCNLAVGDLLGSGTVSGPTDESRACLAEITERGTQALALPNGESRAWLLDGDEVILRGRAERDGFVGIGFGECRAVILPSPPWPE